MSSPVRRRGARGSGYEKLAVSLPRDTAKNLRAEAAARGAPSLSAYVTAMIEEKLERNELRAMLDEIFAAEPMTDAEREWADRALGLD